MGSVNQVSQLFRETFATLTRQGNTTQYAAGDVLSAAGTSPANVLTFSNCVFEPGKGGKIHSARLIMNSNQSTKPNIDLFLFAITPATDFGDDNEAFDLADADLANCIGVITFDGTTAANVVVGDPGSDAAGNCVIKNESVDLIFQCSKGSKKLYGIPVVRNTTYDPLNADGLKFVLSIEQ